MFATRRDVRTNYLKHNASQTDVKYKYAGYALSTKVDA